ncbi:hypothetical protein [Luteococcus sp.]|uniref:hypothetical protein n=1 Tax=Luteococcus sp. TaxID=1969402 RepID=UPI0037356899
MSSTALRALAALSLTAGLAIAAPTQAAAASSKCAIVQARTVAGYNFSTMPTRRVCSQSLAYGTSGVAKLASKTIVVNYSARRTSNQQVGKATLHELTHHVEYRTTPARRAKLYGYVGLGDAKGNYFAVKDSYYHNGSLARWKQSPRERLAESVVNCTYGSPNHKGMKLVPRSQCKSFLKDYEAAIAAAR